MKVRLLFLLLSLWGLLVQAQPMNNALKDTVRDRFLVRGAWNYSYFSQEWQCYLDSAIAMNPDDAYLWQQKSMPLFKRQQYEIGMVYLNKAVALDSLAYLDYRAFIKCIFAKTYREAIVDFENAKAIKAKGVVMDHPYDFYIGLCYLQLREWKRGAGYFISNIDTIEKQRGATWSHYLDWFYLGICYYESGEYDKAIQALQACLKRYPQFADAQYYLGLIYHKLGNEEVSQSYFKDAASNLQAGCTITEDSVFYEQFPYQLKKYWLKNYIKTP